MSEQPNRASGVDGLAEFLSVLKASDDLIEIREPLAPRLEIGAVLATLGERAGPAAVFTSVTDYSDSRVAGNIFGCRRRVAQALGVGETGMRSAYLERARLRFRPEIVGRQDFKYTTVTGTHIDMSRQIPVLTHHLADSSPYLTCSVAVARDPVTGELSMGVHRVQLRSRRNLAAYLATPPLSRFLQEAWRQNRPLEVALVNGIHPAIVIAAVTWCPGDENKLELAGGLLGGPLALVQCEAVDLQVPCGFQYLIEGLIEPGHLGVEGLFGESSGVYVDGSESPIVDVKSVTWRQDPIYQALQPWSSEDDVLFDLCYGSDLLANLQADFPFIEDLHVVGGAVCAYVILRVGECSPKLLHAAMREALTHNPFVKKVVVVNDDIDIQNEREVEWAIATRFQADRDLLVLKDVPGSPIDPSSGSGSLTGKMGLDATFVKEQRMTFRRVSIDAQSRELARHVVRNALSSPNQEGQGGR